MSSAARPLHEGGRPGPGQVDGQFAFTDFAAIVHFHRLARLLRRGHHHEAVPPRAAIELVGHQRGGNDRADVEEHRLEVVASDAVRQVANVQKGFIHGRKTGREGGLRPSDVRLAQAAGRRQFAPGQAGENSPSHTSCVRVTQLPLGQALQTQ